MSRRNYYCLIAGLPDIVHDDKKLHFSSVKLREYLREELHPTDFECIRLFYYPYDNLNILNLLFKKGKPWDERGNLTSDQLETILHPLLFEEVKTKDYPGYIIRFGNWLRSKEETDEKCTYEEASRLLTEGYYATLLQSDNDFIRKLAGYQVNTGNILLALNGQKHDLPFEEALVGDNLIVNALKKNRTRDFGLAVDYPEVENIIHHFETDNILEREMKFDIRMWNNIDDLTTFHYFSLERVLAFTLKVFIVERWFHLDFEKGQVMFNKLLNEIETSFEFPEEFSHAYGKKR